MPSFLTTLSEIHKAEAQSATLRLQAAERQHDRLSKIAQTQQLLESCNWDTADPVQGGHAIPAGLGSAANDLLQYTAMGFHSARPGSRRDGAYPPFYRTEQEHLMIVDAARTLEAFCPTAVNILDVLDEFAIHTGFHYKIVEKKQPGDAEPPEMAEDAKGSAPGDEAPAKPKSNPTVDKAQKLLDRWMKDVDWPGWEHEIFRRSRRDGESFLIMEPDDETEMLGLRSVEPEQVRDPQGASGSLNGQLGITGRDASWRFGVLTHKQDTSKPLAYNVVSQDGDQRQHEVFDADEVFHLAVNKDRCAKRGVSDFFSVANDIPGTKKLLRNLREGAEEQATIAYILQQAAGMSGLPDAVGSGGGSGPSRTGRRVSQKVSDGVEIITTSTGVEYKEAPIGQSDTLIQVLQAALRNIAARWQIPEGIASGDASNANLASALVAEAPFVRAMESRQWLYRMFYIRVIERVIEQAAIDGLLPDGENILDKIEVTVEMPPVVPRKALEETQKNEILSKNHILGNATWSAREDLDREEELADMEADPIQSEEIMLGFGGEAEDDTAGEGSDSTNGERVS